MGNGSFRVARGIRPGLKAVGFWKQRVVRSASKEMIRMLIWMLMETVIKANSSSCATHRIKCW